MVTVKEVLENGTTDIVMVRTTDGFCPKACNHCGAFPAPGNRPTALLDTTRASLRSAFPDRREMIKATPLGKYNVGILVSLTREEIAENLDQPIAGTDKPLHTLLGPIVTQDVNIDPCLDDGLINLAELVHDRKPGPINQEEADEEGTERGSRVIWLSHGVDGDFDDEGNFVPDPEQARRFKRIVRLMKTGVIPGGILTIDTQQYCGKHDEPRYRAGYIYTMTLLRSILADGSARITISIQGQHNKHYEDGRPNPMYIGSADAMVQSILNELQLTHEERSNLNWNRNRPVVRAGRGIVLAGPGGECPVIPDDFIVENVLSNKLYRAGIAMDGTVYRQLNKPDETYGATVDPNGWEKLDNSTPEGVFLEVSGQVDEVVEPDAEAEASV
ncbi:MAG: hypothetical protein O3B47_01195 [bacterium]|nr:hypothetical protein [bacterium]